MASQKVRLLGAGVLFGLLLIVVFRALNQDVAIVGASEFAIREPSRQGTYTLFSVRRVEEYNPTLNAQAGDLMVTFDSKDRSARPRAKITSNDATTFQVDSKLTSDEPFELYFLIPGGWSPKVKTLRIELGPSNWTIRQLPPPNALPQPPDAAQTGVSASRTKGRLDTIAARFQQIYLNGYPLVPVGSQFAAPGDPQEFTNPWLVAATEIHAYYQKPSPEVPLLEVTIDLSAKLKPQAGLIPGLESDPKADVFCSAFSPAVRTKAGDVIALSLANQAGEWGLGVQAGPPILRAKFVSPPDAKTTARWRAALQQKPHREIPLGKHKIRVFQIPVQQRELLVTVPIKDAP